MSEWAGGHDIPIHFHNSPFSSRYTHILSLLLSARKSSYIGLSCSGKEGIGCECYLEMMMFTKKCIFSGYCFYTSLFLKEAYTYLTFVRHSY